MNAEIMLQLTIKCMKKIILFLLAFAAIKSFGQTDEQKVLDRVKQLNAAIFINRDSLALEALMADKVTYGHSSAKIENRSEMIAGAVHSPSTFKNFMMDSATVFFEGKNIAVVRHVLRATSVDMQGKESPLHLNVLQVWVMQKNQWKLMARQAVKL